MALWQFRLILLPRRALLEQFGIVPVSISMEAAEDYHWWSDVQPPEGFERQIDSMLPRKESWSTGMRMWGQEDSNDAYVSYKDENMNAVEEIAFRIDARAISADLTSAICTFARNLDCLLMTQEYEILAPERSVILQTVNTSIARRYVVDPVSTLQSLEKGKIEKRINYLTNHKGKISG